MFERIALKRRRGAFVAVLASCGLGLVAGCGRHDQPPDIIERAGGAERLREAALAVRSYAPQDDSEVPVPQNTWPEPFRRLAPVVVLVDAGGVNVTLAADTLYASGLYISFEVSNKPKGLGEDLSYDQIVPGIYWYRLVMGG